MGKVLGVTDPAKIMGLANIARVMGTGGFVVETHDGASFWPTYPGLIALDGSAAIRFEGVDISPFAGVAGSSTPYRIDLYDSSLNLVSGYLAEADAGEPLGSDAVSGWDFTDGWLTSADMTIDDADSFTSGDNSKYIRKSGFLTIGKLYKVTYAGTTPTTLDLQNFSVSKSYISDFGTAYFISSDTGLCFISRGIGTTDITTFTVEEVIHLGADGCHVVSAKNGATPNWASQEDGFNYNDSGGYTFNITST